MKGAVAVRFGKRWHVIDNTRLGLTRCGREASEAWPTPQFAREIPPELRCRGGCRTYWPAHLTLVRGA